MDKLITEIIKNIEYTASFSGVSHLDPKIIKAFKDVPRKDFVLPTYMDQAYDDQALPIGYGQTISQPFIVAIMTQLLEPKPEDKILEIGSGSGFQAAILSKLVHKVFSLEVVPELVLLAQKNLKKQHINNVEIILKDGNNGLSTQAPFDKIIFTACAPSLPLVLLEQLKEGGIMVGPIKKSEGQMLVKITKQSREKIIIKDIFPVRFVPFVNQQARHP